MTQHTIIWGEDVEANDFIKLPRVVTRLGRYDSRVGKTIQPRHILLILSLAGRQFRTKPIRATWEILARDLGVKRETVRKWGAEMKVAGLLKIRRPSPKDEDRRRIFDIAPFVELAQEAHANRSIERQLFIERQMEEVDAPF